MFSYSAFLYISIECVHYHQVPTTQANFGWHILKMADILMNDQSADNVITYL